MSTSSTNPWSISDAEEARAEAVTLSVFDNLFARLKRRNFALRFWDGKELPAESSEEPDFTLVLTHPGSLRRMFLPPGELSLAEAYLRGDFDVEGDIIALMKVAQGFESFTAREWLSLLRQVWSLPLTELPSQFQEGRQPLDLGGKQHSLERDRSAVTYHYDTGNDFYRLFLGNWMAYSCAYFDDPENGLDPAQEAKFEHICRKLRLKPGERLLDIGCGWGGLVIYAAGKYGVEATGITLSQPQVDYARQWIEQSDLEHRVTVAPLDYRDIDQEQPFDKVVSVGMVEHVGQAKFDEYFQAAMNSLRPGGLFLNHAIATHRAKPDSWFERTFLQRGRFMQRYVFPDGELVRIGKMLTAAERNGFEVRDVESLREHYALTLRHWIANLETNYQKAVELTDERTYRTWRLYMAASVQGFESAGINIYQSLLSKSQNGKTEVALTRADLYA